MPTYLKFFSENKDAIVAIAALGALAMTALTACLSLFGTIFAKRIDANIKMQESMRAFLEDSMIGLGENLHEIMASADIMVQKFQLNSPSPNLEESIKELQSKDRQQQEASLEGENDLPIQDLRPTGGDSDYRPGG